MYLCGYPITAFPPESVMAMSAGASSVCVLFYPESLIQSVVHSAYSRKAVEQITEIQGKTELELSFEDRWKNWDGSRMRKGHQVGWWLAMGVREGVERLGVISKDSCLIHQGPRSLRSRYVHTGVLSENRFGFLYDLISETIKNHQKYWVGMDMGGLCS